MQQPSLQPSSPALQMAHLTHEEIQLRIEFADLDQS